MSSLAHRLAARIRPAHGGYPPPPGRHFTEVRVPRWDLTNPRTVAGIFALPGLERVELNPPAAGPEAALIFRTADGCDAAGEEFIASEVRRMGATVLATRSGTR